MNLKALWSLFLAFLISLFSWIPGFSSIVGTIDNDGVAEEIAGYTNGEWVKNLLAAFNKAVDYESATPYLDSVPADDPYFAEFQTAYEWGVVTDADDGVDSAAYVDKSFVAATLVRVAQLAKNFDVSGALEKIGQFVSEELAIADYFGLVAQLENNGPISKANADAALAKALDLFKNPVIPEAFSVDTVDSLSAQGFGGGSGAIDTSDPNAAAAAVIDEVEVAGTFAPDIRASVITDANGTVLNEGVAGDPDSVSVQGIGAQGFSLDDLKNLGSFDVKQILNLVDWKSLLKKINFDIAIPNTSLKAKVAVIDDGFLAQISGPVVTGDAGSLSITKSYELTNFNISTNLSADLIGSKLDYAYFRAAYDVKDYTQISGSATGSLVENTDVTGNDALSDLEKAQAGLVKLVAGSGGEITLFKAVVPIPNFPALTVDISFNLVLTLDGKIAITVTSKDLAGFVYENGKGSPIFEHSIISKNYYVDANAKALANVNVDLSLLGYLLIDVGVYGGIGANVWVSATFDKGDGSPLETKKLDLPFEVYTTIGANNDALTLDGYAKVYGILEIYYCKDSILAKVIPAKYRYFKIFGDPQDDDVYYPELSAIWAGPITAPVNV